MTSPAVTLSAAMLTARSAILPPIAKAACRAMLCRGAGASRTVGTAARWTSKECASRAGSPWGTARGAPSIHRTPSPARTATRDSTWLRAAASPAVRPSATAGSAVLLRRARCALAATPSSTAPASPIGAKSETACSVGTTAQASARSAQWVSG
jgi:hypothetical protein